MSIKNKVPDEVSHLINVVKAGPPQNVSAWLSNYVEENVSRELELIATHILSTNTLHSDFVEVNAAISRGLVQDGLDLLVSRLRRRMAKILRDHQRVESKKCPHCGEES